MAISQFVDARPQTGQRLLFGSAAPTAGTWNAGDELFVSPNEGVSITALLPDKYRCVAAGTPGTWVAMGAASNVGTAIASAATVAPVARVTHITGTAAVVNITLPTGFPDGGQITLIPDGIFTWTAAGNIAVLGTAVVSRALTMTYDATAVKWYPSYV